MGKNFSNKSMMIDELSKYLEKLFEKYKVNVAFDIDFNDVAQTIIEDIEVNLSHGKINFDKKNFSERLMKCFSFIYHVRLTDRNDKSKSVSIDNLEAGSWQEAVDKVITDHPEFGLKPGDYEGSDKVEVHWNYGENTLKSF